MAGLGLAGPGKAWLAGETWWYGSGLTRLWKGCRIGAFNSRRMAAIIIRTEEPNMVKTFIEYLSDLTERYPTITDKKEKSSELNSLIFEIEREFHNIAFGDIIEASEIGRIWGI